MTFIGQGRRYGRTQALLRSCGKSRMILDGMLSGQVADPFDYDPAPVHLRTLGLSGCSLERLTTYNTETDQ